MDLEQSCESVTDQADPPGQTHTDPTFRPDPSSQPTQSVTDLSKGTDAHIHSFILPWCSATRGRRAAHAVAVGGHVGALMRGARAEAPRARGGGRHRVYILIRGNATSARSLGPLQADKVAR